MITAWLNGWMSEMNLWIYTCVGVVALLLWSTLVGFLRLSTESFGAIHAVTYIYTLSAIILVLSYGFPNFKQANKKFLLISSGMFVIFELCFAFSITLANSSEKSIEMNILFNIWPTLIIVIMAFLKEEKVNLITIFGIGISFLGIILINQQAQLNFIENMMTNPASYALIILAAIFWAIYCIYTKKYSGGTNAISLYFSLTAVTLWLITLFTEGLSLPEAQHHYGYIFVALNALFFSMGYLAWNLGIIRGNMPILIMLSYFSPILSSVFSAFALGSQLSAHFWYGAIVVTLGSLICWFSVRSKPAALEKTKPT